MTDQAPAPLPAEPVAPGTAVQTSVVRGLTPLALAAVAGALSKANIKFDSTVETYIVSGAVSVVVGAVFTLLGRWLETFKSSKWGKLFLVAKAPTYSATPAPPQ